MINHCFGELADLPRLTAKLLKDKPSLVVVWGSAAGTQLVRQAAPLLPIVFVDIAEPVESGLVDSLSHPSGNMAGISNNTDELIARGSRFSGRHFRGLPDWGYWSNLANRFQVGYLRTVQESARSLNSGNSNI